MNYSEENLNLEIQLPYFLTLTQTEQKNTIEALIFASEEVLNTEQIFNLLTQKDEVEKRHSSEDKKNILEQSLFENIVESRFSFNRAMIDRLVAEINEDLETSGRPFRIVNFAGGYQFVTISKYGEIVSILLKLKSKKRLSQAALEALAIIAYKQPISKSGVEQIRGVNSNEIVNTLIEKNFVKIVGRSEQLGKSILYGTTDEFLKAFGLVSIKDLPKLKEIEDIANENLHQNEDENDFTIKINEDDMQNVKINGISLQETLAKANEESVDFSFNLN